MPYVRQVSGSSIDRQVCGIKIDFEHLRLHRILTRSCCNAARDKGIGNHSAHNCRCRRGEIRVETRFERAVGQQPERNPRGEGRATAMGRPFGGCECGALVQQVLERQPLR